MQNKLNLISFAIAAFSGLIFAIGVAYALIVLTDLGALASSAIGAVIGGSDYLALRFVLSKHLKGEIRRENSARPGIWRFDYRIRARRFILSTKSEFGFGPANRGRGGGFGLPGARLGR